MSVGLLICFNFIVLLKDQKQRKLSCILTKITTTCLKQITSKLIVCVPALYIYYFWTV